MPSSFCVALRPVCVSPLPGPCRALDMEIHSKNVNKWLDGCQYYAIRKAEAEQLRFEGGFCKKALDILTL